MSTFTIETTFATCCCASCGIQYAIPERRQRELRENHETFYCPNGHTQWYPQKSEAEKLRDELKRKEQAAKAKAEIIKKIDDLGAALESADDVTPEVQAAFDALKAEVQGIDDIVPDAPTT